MQANKNINITWHHGHISRDSKEELLGQKGVLLWFTGLPASGKSTITHALEEALFKMGYLAIVLDGDNVRHGLNRDLGFSPEDRKENIRRVAEAAKLFLENGTITIAAFISPYESDRQMVRSIVETDDYLEVYVRCPVAVASERDPKGLYKKAIAGEIKDFTGVSAPYEEPAHPDILIDSDLVSVDEAVKMILSRLSQDGFISGSESLADSSSD